ncbi:50S ribosomal protein L13 [Candidatus Uhrbacteria bacterium]|nr:50S ribosomal protein L13 [Candidatus Uhrbacteria bacterium]
MTEAQRKVHTIDASGKTVGRLATQIVRLLQGKHKPTYLPNVDEGDTIEITNIGQLKFTGKKLAQRVYYKHSGYLGNLKVIPMKKVFAENPRAVLERAVRQMLPKNRLLPGRIKRLLFKA